MGWSCTKRAMDTLDRLAEASRKEGERSSNSFTVDGRHYFYVHDCVEYPDGHITGQVFLMLGGTGCLLVEPFLIQPDGQLVGGHAWMRKAAAPEVLPEPRSRQPA
jgi:hypothetical protein